MKKALLLSTLFLGLFLLTGCGMDPLPNPNDDNSKPNGINQEPDGDNQKPNDANPKPKPPQVSGKCGMENCHGLEITCGPNTREACDSMYVFGDNCRQYASCQNTNGECKLEKTAKFDTCKSCVEKCAKTFPNDPMKNAECESKCSE
jgi:predicted small lipoprotein YifL